MRWVAAWVLRVGVAVNEGTLLGGLMPKTSQQVAIGITDPPDCVQLGAAHPPAGSLSRPVQRSKTLAWPPSRRKALPGNDGAVVVEPDVASVAVGGSLVGCGPAMLGQGVAAVGAVVAEVVQPPRLPGDARLPWGVGLQGGELVGGHAQVGGEVVRAAVAVGRARNVVAVVRVGPGLGRVRSVAQILHKAVAGTLPVAGDQTVGAVVVGKVAGLVVAGGIQRHVPSIPRGAVCRGRPIGGAVWSFGAPNSACWCR